MTDNNKIDYDTPPDMVNPQDYVAVILVDKDGRTNSYMRQIGVDVLGDILVDLAGDYRYGGQFWQEHNPDTKFTEEELDQLENYTPALRSIDPVETPVVILFHENGKVEVRIHELDPVEVANMLIGVGHNLINDVSKLN
jgi:hypothetical protein